MCHVISHCDVTCDNASLSLAQAPGQPVPVAAGSTNSSLSEACSTNPWSTPEAARPLAATTAGLDGVVGVGGNGGCLRRMARGQPLLLHCCKAAQTVAQQAAASAARAAAQRMEWSRKPDHAQNRNGPDKPDQRRPKNRISCH